MPGPGPHRLALAISLQAISLQAISLQAIPLLAVLLLAIGAAAQDWGNYGGNAARNGRSSTSGPLTLQAQWSDTSDWSIISWHPFIEGDRVFTIREAGFPVQGGAANDALVAYDLETGAELWRVTLSYGGNTAAEWIAWCGGANGGRVYASRASNLQPQPLQAFDAATGALSWVSTYATEAWAHDGLVFASNGDVILADRLNVVRIDATNGQTLWISPRSCPVSGACGAAATADAVFIDQAAPGGNEITKLDIVTGAVLYSSPVMVGVTDQNTPFVSSDGQTVYLSRTQNNPVTDFLYAFTDTGTALDLAWSREALWTTQHGHGIAADGSIYSFLPGGEFVRLDPSNGVVTGSAGVLAPMGNHPTTAVDASGTVYLSNGWASSPASNGRLWAFNEDLSTTWFTLPLDRQNIGGPALGGDGTLVMCDRQGIYAWRDGPWLDLGQGKPGSGALLPVLAGSGPLQANTPGALDLTDAAPSTSTTLVVGFSELGAPFKGGVLVPNPDLFLGPIGVDAAGNSSLPFVFPAGVPAGFAFWVQHWIQDVGASFGLSASNALKGTAQ